MAGQSMTEFLFCASFFLVPLFLGISLLGKYIDIKQTNIAAARYQAWEYTVWFANNREPMTGFDAADQPIKSTRFTQNESQQRFFTAIGDETTTLPITAIDGNTGWTAATANPLWSDHRGDRLYQGRTGAANSLRSSEDTPTIPLVGDAVNLILDAFDFFFGLIGSVMNFAGSSVGFTAINTDGYAMSNSSVEVNVNPTFVNIDSIHGARGTSDELTGGTLDFSTRASVLSDAWNAGGAEHTRNQAGGTVITTLFKELFDAIPGFNAIWSILSVFSPELRPCNPGFPYRNDDKGSLWLGYIDIDAVHPDRLISDPTNPDMRGTHMCDKAGNCDFVPVVPRTEASRVCD